MRTGPEHYAEAERLLAAASSIPVEAAATAQETLAAAAAINLLYVAAQVRATLALTAATTGQETLGSEWREALGYPPIPYNSPDSLGPL